MYLIMSDFFCTRLRRFFLRPDIPHIVILTHIRTGGLNHRACAGVDT